MQIVFLGAKTWPIPIRSQENNTDNRSRDFEDSSYQRAEKISYTQYSAVKSVKCGIMFSIKLSRISTDAMCLLAHDSWQRAYRRWHHAGKLLPSSLLMASRISA